MNPARILRSIREKRRKKLLDDQLFPSFILTKEQYKQLLIIDPPYKLDIVSLMKMWREKRMQMEDKLNTSSRIIINQWIEAGKDPEERKNRRNGIHSLINHRAVITRSEDVQELTLRYFMESNRRNLVNDRIRNISPLTEHTKKTYRVMFGSLYRYLARFLYGPSQRHAKKLKPLKRGIRPLELQEAAPIFDLLEKKAIQSLVAMRDLLIMRLLMYAGEHIEIKNLFTLRREDINFEERIVNIKVRHSKKIKKVECSNDFINLLKSFLGRRKEYFFIKNTTEKIQQDLVNKRLSRVAQEADVSNITLKSVQRSYFYILKKIGII